MRLILVFLLLLLLQTCSSFNKEEILKEFSENELEYFLDIAFNTEYQEKVGHKLRLWTRDVHIELCGEYNAEDSLEVIKIISELNILINTINISIVEKQGNLKIYFINNYNFSSYFDVSENVRGYFVIKWNRFFTDGFILIDKNQKCLIRKHLLREEITQSLGLMNDSWKYPGSIFYQGYSDRIEYTEMDKKMIELLYNYKLPFYYTVENFIEEILNRKLEE